MKTKRVVNILLILLIIGWAILALAVFDGLDNLIVKLLITNEAPQKSDVIIILGGGVDKDIHDTGPAVDKRLDKGIELWQNEYASYIIVAGGLVKKTGYTEADKLMDYALEKGVPASNVIKESRSLNTYQNALFSQEIMKQNGWQTALVTTSDYHTKRACKIFRKLNMNVKCVAASVPQDRPSYKLDYFRAILREYAATVYYWLKGYI